MSGSSGVSKAEIFCDLKPPLDPAQAKIESDRCYHCYDAPCIEACPTEINIPAFIGRIAQENPIGAAVEILTANILGASCARVCPVETLCQDACVRNTAQDRPVEIAQLQRYATDRLLEKGTRPFVRGEDLGHRVAVVGAGPAGLSCAHELARLGYRVTVYDARDKAGGLSEYGIAPYKVTDDIVQRELEFVLGIGGIELELGRALGKDLSLGQLKKDFSAVFLGVGLGSAKKLGVPGEALAGVRDATDWIAQLRQAPDLAQPEITQVKRATDIVVIGGGNTAIDIAVECKKLGAENVTIAYRRGLSEMGATWHEQEIAKGHGVLIRPYLKPLRISEVVNTGKSPGAPPLTRYAIEFEENSNTTTRRLEAQLIFKAIGQSLSLSKAAADVGAGDGRLELAGGKIWVDDRFETSIPGVYAGGDCISRGEDLTVTAVQHGKLAARAIHEKLTGRSKGTTQIKPSGGKNG